MKPYKLPQKYLEFKEFHKHYEKIIQVKPKAIDVTLGGIPPMLNNLSYLYNVWAQGYPVYCDGIGEFSLTVRGESKLK